MKHDLELLKLQAEIGVDLAISQQPINRLKDPVVIKNTQDQQLKPAPVAQIDIMAKSATLRSNPAKVIGPQQAMLDAKKLADEANTLEELEKAVRGFDGCAIKKTANKTVFCDGNPKAKVMLVGEAPGANEDLEGIPFCGQSGKLLDEIFASINFSRKTNLYITNTLFWRPPGNRRPTPEEIEICRPFVKKHIALVKPDLLVMVGSTAVESLLQKTGSMTATRGKFIEYSNEYHPEKIQAIAIFHPSYLLRQPSQKKVMWQDMLLIRKFLDK